MISAFIERWRLKTQTFHLLFGECTITLQDVAYQMRFSLDGEAVSGCLTNFENFIKDGRPAWECCQELFDELLPLNKLKLGFSRIGMVISTHVLGGQQKCHQLGRSFSAAIELDFLAVSHSEATRWEAYLPTNDGKEQILIQYRLALDRLGGRDIVWELYTALDILVVVHPEILMEERFDRVVPQLGSVQHVPEPALNIDWLYIKDGRGGDRPVCGVLRLVAPSGAQDSVAGSRIR
ncbi:uncharacterized protein DS421_4g118220 [Arachis hypogaea]|nr:uncharacterized protein DS421_4g118220 [Arachis hypogaea]